MVASPFDYPWSSAHANAGNRRDELVTPHDEYARLGRDAARRASMYRAILALGLDVTEIRTIRQQVNRNAALGRAACQQAVARKAGRVPSQRGRPRSPDAASARHAEVGR